MRNLDIRDEIKAAGLKHWQVAETLGINQGTLCVWLRSELTPARRQQITEAIRRAQTGGLYAGDDQ